MMNPELIVTGLSSLATGLGGLWLGRRARALKDEGNEIDNETRAYDLYERAMASEGRVRELLEQAREENREIRAENARWMQENKSIREELAACLAARLSITEEMKTLRMEVRRIVEREVSKEEAEIVVVPTERPAL